MPPLQEVKQSDGVLAVAFVKASGRGYYPQWNVEKRGLWHKGKYLSCESVFFLCVSHLPLKDVLLICTQLLH